MVRCDEADWLPFLLPLLNFVALHALASGVLPDQSLVSLRVFLLLLLPSFVVYPFCFGPKSSSASAFVRVLAQDQSHETIDRAVTCIEGN